MLDAARRAEPRREVRHLVQLQERAHRPGARERQEVAAGEPGRPRRSRGQGPRGARPAGRRLAQVASIRAPRRELDLKAARLAAGDLLSRRAWSRARPRGARLQRRGAPGRRDRRRRRSRLPRLPGRRRLRPPLGRHAGAARLRRRPPARRAADPWGRARPHRGGADRVDRGAQLEEARRLARRRLPALPRRPPESRRPPAATTSSAAASPAPSSPSRPRAPLPGRAAVRGAISCSGAATGTSVVGFDGGRRQADRPSRVAPQASARQRAAVQPGWYNRFYDR